MKIFYGGEKMTELEKKYVFHVPLYKYVDGELVLIEIEDILEELFAQFYSNGFDSLYMAKIKSYYKKRLYDEILITIFTSGDSPVCIFEEWFRKNNDVLCQEALAYEIGCRMVIRSFS